jgi:hypothetical protein
MSIKTKRRFKNVGKIIGAILFALILFANIKIALLDDAEIACGDISLVGVELELFEPTYACEVTFEDCQAICETTYLRHCTIMIGYGDCPGKPMYW